MVRLLPALAALSALAGCTAGQVIAPPSGDPAAAAAPFEVHRLREERKLAAGVRVVVIDNPYGEIQVRQTDAQAIAIAAVEQRIGTKPRVARIEWFDGADRQGLRVRYPGLDPRRPADPRRGRVDLVVFVPAGPKLEVRSDFGAIVVRRLNNAVQAESRSGPITIAARGAIEARSERGAIRLFPMEVPPGARYAAVTGGEVYAELPVFAPLALEVEARESLLAEIAFDRRERGMRGERAELRLGSGEVPFRLRGRTVALMPVAAAVP
jgi:hypothetical protein